MTREASPATRRWPFSPGGFINLKLPGLLEVLAQRLRQVIAATAIESV